MGTFFVWKRYFEADLIKQIPLLEGHTKELGILVTCAIGIPLIICSICLERHLEAIENLVMVIM